MSGDCRRCGASLQAGVGRCSKCGAPRAPAPETASQWGGLDVKKPARPDASELGTAATMISRPVAPPSGKPPATPPRAVAPAPPGRGFGLGGDDELVVLSNSSALDMGVASSAPSAALAPGAALELDAPVAKRRVRREDAAEAKQARSERIHQLADFGPVGSSSLEVIQYAVRVMLRRRALQAELVDLRAKRQEAESAAHAAQEALGEAIFERRSEPKLQPVVRELRAVAEAMVALEDTRSAGQDAEAKAQGSVDQLTTQIAALEQQLEPVRGREKSLLGSINQLEQQRARLQALDKRAQIELRALAQAQQGDPTRAATLQAEQRGRVGELASLEVQLQPFSEELGEVRRELAKHAGTIAALQEDRKGALRAMGELRKQHDATSGSAQQQQRSALRALTLALIERNLGGLEPELMERVSAADAELDKRDEAVRVHDAAFESFEPGAFRRGRTLAVAAVVALVAALVALILR